MVRNCRAETGKDKRRSTNKEKGKRLQTADKSQEEDIMMYPPKDVRRIVMARSSTLTGKNR